MNPSDPISWYRRLSFKLALLVALAILSYGWLAPRLFHAGWDLFVEPEDPTPKLRAAVDLSLPDDIDSLAYDVLTSSIDNADVKLELRVRNLYGANYVVLDTSLRILAASEALQNEVGQQLAKGHNMQAWRYAPILRDGSCFGWLCLLKQEVVTSTDPAFGQAPLQPEGGLSQTELLAQHKNRARQLEVFVSTTLMISAAVIIGMLVSWLITRRLSRLTAVLQVDQHFGEARSVVSGRDEIAVLSQALHESGKRATKLLAELKQKDVERGEWVAQVSHDLRTPLTALDCSLQRALALFESSTAATYLDEIREAVNVAHQDTKRVVSLSTDLLEYARLELPDALRLEALPLAEIAERAVTGLTPIAQSAQKSLELIAPESESMVLVDASRLLRVFENLIRNAIEHAQSRVTVGLTEFPDRFQVRIEDDGAGFLSESGHVYYKSKESKSTGSTGLGLTVVEKILTAHETSLQLSNQHNGGARAMFELAKLTDG